MSSSPFSAPGSALGYLYQCRYGLLSALRRMRSKESEFAILMETLDDVVFESDGSATELLQMKHHLSRRGSLSDASDDIWRTLRVWSEALAERVLLPDTVFHLITTAIAGPGTAASYLRLEERNAAAALGRLRAVALTSGSRSNSPAYDSFLSLSEPEQLSLLESVFVLDAAPPIEGIDAELAREVMWAAEAHQRASLLSRLEGWWFRRVITHLTSGGQTPILSAEIAAQIDDLREQFKRDNLPIDEDLLEVEVDFSDYQDRVFVHQLSLIDIVGRRVMFAIKDYYRAYEQRSRWVRESLLYVGDLGRYESRLKEEWDRRFEVMRSRLGTDATEDAKKRAAQSIYEWVELEANIPVRPQCTEPWVTRGSYQMLADEQRVGWHPDFADRLKRLLEASPST